MSSIVVAGNTSGSVTLAAPDVAGTTTLTLPATSGTIVAPSSAGTSGQVLTSNGAGSSPTYQDLPAGGVTSLNGQTGTITNTDYGAIGSYVAAYGASNTAYSVGSTIAGSSLNKSQSNTFGGFNFINAISGTAAGQVLTQASNLSSLGLSGTWRTMTTGGSSVPSAGYAQFHLWVRIS